MTVIPGVRMTVLRGAVGVVIFIVKTFAKMAITQISSSSLGSWAIPYRGG